MYLCESKIDHKKYAVKHVDLSKVSTREYTNAMGEAQQLSKLHHPNIIRMEEYTVDAK